MKEREETLQEEFMPVFHTIIFEIKRQSKKFYFFLSITILIVFLTSTAYISTGGYAFRLTPIIYT